MRADRLTQFLGLALAALLTLAASGVHGAVHHLAEHAPHAAPTLAHDHNHDHAGHHACHHHGSQDNRESPTDDSDHEDGECKLCHMLAQAGKWGGWSASDPILIQVPRAQAVLEHTSVILTRTRGVQRSRGPPTSAS